MCTSLRMKNIQLPVIYSTLKVIASSKRKVNYFGINIAVADPVRFWPRFGSDWENLSGPTWGKKKERKQNKAMLEDILSRRQLRSYWMNTELRYRYHTQQLSRISPVLQSTALNLLKFTAVSYTLTVHIIITNVQYCKAESGSGQQIPDPNPTESAQP